MSDYKSIYDRLFSEYGPQSWWPAETPFEVMVGAILTQNTAWLNVERAITNLRNAGLLSAPAMLETSHAKLAPLIKPSGYFNVKAERLLGFVRWYCQQGQYDSLKKLHTARLRKALLSVKGIGPETADDILLYAFNRKVFVIDAYTRRIFSRLGYIDNAMTYEALRAVIEAGLEVENTRVFNEYHALIVKHGKEGCKVRPDCSRCCLETLCPKNGLGDD